MVIVNVPEKTTVIVNAWAIAGDPAHWDRADEFLPVPERFQRDGRDFKGADFELILFGAGRWMCPAMAFGLAHIELALAALLFHFDCELPGGVAAEDLDMREAFGVTVTAQRRDMTLSWSRFLVFHCPWSRKTEQVCVCWHGSFKAKCLANCVLWPHAVVLFPVI
jgi:hypothetical protein